MAKQHEDKQTAWEGEILPLHRLSRHFKNAEQKAGVNEKSVKNKFWKTLTKASKQIPAIEKVVAAYYCAFDPKTSTRTRAILLAALAYFVLPFDTIPDFIFGFGFTDDVAVLTFAIGALKNEIKQKHIDAAKEKLKDK